MSRFTLPRDIYYGPGALDELKVLAGHKKAMIFTGGSSMRRGGFLQKTEEVLKAAGLETALFEGIEPDPSIETVMKGAQAMREFEPDVIVAIGGGSPIDAAKAMWVFYEHPDKTFEDIKTPFTMPKLRNKAIFVAIPSTSGTASEVTAFSVITDYSSGIKYPLADFEITPDIAVLDTDIPLTMPPKQRSTRQNAHCPVPRRHGVQQRAFGHCPQPGAQNRRSIPHSARLLQRNSFAVRYPVQLPRMHEPLCSSCTLPRPARRHRQAAYRFAC